MGVVIPFNPPAHRHDIKIDFETGQYSAIYCSIHDKNLEQGIISERYTWRPETLDWECAVLVKDPSDSPAIETWWWFTNIAATAGTARESCMLNCKYLSNSREIT